MLFFHGSLVKGVRMEYNEYLQSTLRAFQAMNSLDRDISLALELMEKSVSQGGTLYFCGNGGSAADSQHWAAEFVGRFRVNGKPLPAIALTCNTSILTAIANDFSYDSVFSRQVEATGRPGDLLIAITTSGNSKSILEAAKIAQSIGMKVIGFTGESGGELKNQSEVCLKVPSEVTEIIQHIHITLGHYFAGELERKFRIKR
jgi:D-sedoheptulose 7-phosphate isomerase